MPPWRASADRWRRTDPRCGRRWVGGDTAPLPALLRAVVPLDRLADVMTRWAPDRAGERPDADVDAAVAEVSATLDLLGVPREERTGPPRAARGASRRSGPE
jgi:hypothetical protein